MLVFFNLPRDESAPVVWVLLISFIGVHPADTNWLFPCGVNTLLYRDFLIHLVGLEDPEVPQRQADLAGQPALANRSDCPPIRRAD